MGPSSEIVQNGYTRIPDEGSILRAHGFDLTTMAARMIVVLVQTLVLP